MATERSDKLYEAARDAQQKFDYFLLGVVGALCAFIGNSFQPQKLGLNPSSLELLAVLALFGAAVAGFKRIETGNSIVKINSGYLRFQEQRGLLVASCGAPFINAATGETYSQGQIVAEIQALDKIIPTAQRDLDAAGDASLSAYKWRNWLLILGFLMFIGSRVWAPYA